MRIGILLVALFIAAEVLFMTRENLVNLMRADTNSAMKLLDLLSTEVQAVRAELGNFTNKSFAADSRAD